MKKRKKLVPRYKDGGKWKAPLAAGIATAGTLGLGFGLPYGFGVRFGGGETNIPIANHPPLDIENYPINGFQKNFKTVVPGFYTAENSILGPTTEEMTNRILRDKNRMAYEAASKDPNFPESGLRLMETQPRDYELNNEDLRRLAQRTSKKPIYNASSDVTNAERVGKKKGTPIIEWEVPEPTGIDALPGVTWHLDGTVSDLRRDAQILQRHPFMADPNWRDGEIVVGTKGTSRLPAFSTVAQNYGKRFKNTELNLFKPELYPGDREVYDRAMREAYGDDYVPPETPPNRLWPGDYTQNKIAEARNNPSDNGMRWYSDTVASNTKSNSKPLVASAPFGDESDWIPDYIPQSRQRQIRETDPAFLKYRGPEGERFRRNPNFDPNIEENSTTNRRYIKGNFDPDFAHEGPYDLDDTVYYDQRYQQSIAPRSEGNDDWGNTIKANRWIQEANDARDEINTTARMLRDRHPGTNWQAIDKTNRVKRLHSHGEFFRSMRTERGQRVFSGAGNVLNPSSLNQRIIPMQRFAAEKPIETPKHVSSRNFVETTFPGRKSIRKEITYDPNESFGMRRDQIQRRDAEAPMNFPLQHRIPGQDQNRFRHLDPASAVQAVRQDFTNSSISAGFQPDHERRPTQIPMNIPGIKEQESLFEDAEQVIPRDKLPKRITRSVNDIRNDDGHSWTMRTREGRRRQALQDMNPNYNTDTARGPGYNLPQHILNPGGGLGHNSGFKLTSRQNNRTGKFDVIWSPAVNSDLFGNPDRGQVTYKGEAPKKYRMDQYDPSEAMRVRRGYADHMARVQQEDEMSDDGDRREEERLYGKADGGRIPRYADGTVKKYANILIPTAIGTAGAIGIGTGVAAGLGMRYGGGEILPPENEWNKEYLSNLRANIGENKISHGFYVKEDSPLFNKFVHRKAFDSRYEHNKRMSPEELNPRFRFTDGDLRRIAVQNKEGYAYHKKYPDDKEGWLWKAPSQHFLETGETVPDNILIMRQDKPLALKIGRGYVGPPGNRHHNVHTEYTEQRSVDDPSPFPIGPIAGDPDYAQKKADYDASTPDFLGKGSMDEELAQPERISVGRTQAQIDEEDAALRDPIAPNGSGSDEQPTLQWLQERSRQVAEEYERTHPAPVGKVATPAPKPLDIKALDLSAFKPKPTKGRAQVVFWPKPVAQKSTFVPPTPNPTPRVVPQITPIVPQQQSMYSIPNRANQTVAVEHAPLELPDLSQSTMPADVPADVVKGHQSKKPTKVTYKGAPVKLKRSIVTGKWEVDE